MKKFIFLQAHLKEIQNMFLAKGDNIRMSALFNGIKGVGKYSFIKDTIKKWNCSSQEDCNCPVCEKIDKNSTMDICEFNSSESIQDFRKSLQQFQNTPPMELRHKYLILRNMDYYSKEIIDLLLKTIEEKTNFHIFATAVDIDRIRPAMLSRFKRYFVSNYSREDLKSIISHDFKLAYLSNMENKYPFSSIFEMDVFFRFAFSNYYSLLFEKAKTPTDIIMSVNSFMSPINALPICEKLPTIGAFIEYCMIQVREESSERYQQYLRKVLSRYSPSLLSNLNNPEYYAQINLDNQIMSLFLSLFILKSIVE
ncbi:MAG: hypothetical protein WC511_03175 [Candidatus Pacearchaeota archaeon]